jgi:2,6-dihydroxypseudooxynicotine hydrolase
MPVDEKLAETIRLRYPRLLAAGVDWNDAEAVLGRITRFEDWCPEWVRLGAVHEAAGDAALEAGRTITAGAAYARAALYYHVGQFVLFSDRAEKRRVQERQQAAALKALPHLRPAGERIQVPFEGIALPGTLRVPEGPRPAPCVILTAGGDSTKEEFHTLENEFLERGVATFSYDGPGQGLTWIGMKLRPDYEKPVAAVMERLARHPAVDPERLAIWGRSFGGYAAPRAAAGNPALKACVSVGGFYDLDGIWDALPPTARETLRFAFDVDTDRTARERARAYTLAGVLDRLTCPFLIVHSDGDPVCPVAHAERMRREAKGPATLAVFPEGNHACDNIPYKVRPLMADWVAEQLGAPRR